MSTLLLPTVGGTGRQASVTLSTDHLLTVVLGSECFKGGLNDSAAETEDEMEGRFLDTRSVKFYRKNEVIIEQWA